MLSSLKLTSKTYLGKEQTKKVKTILQSILDTNESFDFRSPVDWKGMGLLDYGYFIKNPMDLGTVSTKLKDNRYDHVEEVFDDLQLIWDNCKTYNSPDTWIYNVAEKLQRSFKKMAKNYLPNIAIIVPGRSNPNQKEDKRPSHNTVFEEDENEEVTYHQKMKFYEKIKHLSPSEVAQIVNEINSKCPSAFKQNGNDNAQIVVDNLDSRTFHDIVTMMENMLTKAQQKVANKIKPQE